LDTDNCQNWNGDLEYSNISEDDCLAGVESDTEKDINIEHPESIEKRDVIAAPNFLGFIRPTRKSKRQADKLLVMVNTLEMKCYQGIKKM